jgi:hypothetical protein
MSFAALLAERAEVSLLLDVVRPVIIGAGAIRCGRVGGRGAKETWAIGESRFHSP